MNPLTASHKHLLHRACFGPKLQHLHRGAPGSVAREVQALFASTRHMRPFAFVPVPQERPRPAEALDEAARKARAQQRQQALMSLNKAWLDAMAFGPSPFGEKMAFFWHNHFATRHQHPLAAQKQLNTLRQHALGSFRKLLHALAKDPAMLLFLNNQQNRKEHPNENFARELLERFTLGRGAYTETDVREAARAFTGWTTDFQGEFQFRPRRHDAGQKTFLGKQGNFRGEDILDILLAQRQTARFITEKIYRQFVNPKPQPEIIDAWARQFYESDYDLARLMQQVLTSPHFYESRHRAAHIKSPVEYLVSLMRLLGLRFEAAEGPILLQRLLGQVLLQPPNVAGWPLGQAWIDSNSLLTRLRIPKALLFSEHLPERPKESFAGKEDALGMGRPSLRESLAVSIEWEAFETLSQNRSPSELGKQLAHYLLQLPPDHAFPDLNLLMQEARPSVPPLKHCLLLLLGSPEFQLC